MDFSELMKWTGYIYLEELLEPEDNSLRLFINRSRLNTKNKDIEHLPMIQLDFDSYVSYSVIDECFDRIDKSERSKGKIFRIYTKSNYLDFIKLATNERDDICPSENYVHYQFPCLNHTIDVISWQEPKITVITG